MSCKLCGCAGPDLCAYCAGRVVAKEAEQAARAERLIAGLECPDCGCQEMPVYYTRRRLARVMRVRKCRNCGRKVTTSERIHGQE